MNEKDKDTKSVTFSIDELIPKNDGKIFILNHKTKEYEEVKDGK